MPSVAARTPNLAPTPNSESMDSSAHTDKSHHRDSRLVVEYQTPIPEEDESTETASEPTEPRTPTSDIAPDSHPFKQTAVVDSDDADPSADMPSLKAKPLPRPAPTQPQAVPRAAISRTPSNVKSPPQSEQTAAPERVGLSKRVGSFVRNKLHRTPSHKDVPGSSSVQNEQVFVKTGVDGPAEVSSPPVNIPKYRRLSSFSLSARTTPKSSQGNSPPSPSSPTSTISNEETSPGQRPRLGHKHSASSSTLVAMDKQQPRPGITWAGGGKEGKKNSRFARRRSASTETVPKLANADQTVGLIDTFSKPAAEGVGMKARRLSMSLPDEFVVDTCDLEKEFKSSSVMPGKRGKCLGRGATAEVRIMARRGASGEDLVAVKEFRVREKDEREDDYVKKIQSEYSIAKSLHHPNIVETVRLCTNRGRWNHVMEFCQYGELFTLVERKLFSGGEGGYYSVGDRLCLFKQLLRGVDYLHSHGIAHRDIKLENLLMDKDGHLKISDFGVAEVFSGEHPGLRAAGGECGKNMGEVRLSKPGICGSLPYIAPEVLAKNGEYDPRPLDVWSCAIVYLTMTFGGCPWQAAKTEFEYYARFKKGWDEWLPNHADGQIFDGPDGQPKCGKLFSMINPPPVKRLLLKMLHPNPEMRISIAEVVKTPAVKGIECCCPDSFDDPTHTIDTSKCTAKEMSKMRVTQKHTHKPPKPESRVAKALTHRWDMGDGWT